MKVKDSFLYSILLFFLFSCTCEKLELSKDRKEWYDDLVYDLDDYYIVSSASKFVDTIVVLDKVRKYSNCNRFATGKYQENKQHLDFLSLKYNLVFSVTCSSGLDEYGNNKIVFKSNDLIWVTDNEVADKNIVKEEFIYNNDTLINYRINKSNYKSSIPLDSINVKSIVFNKKYGLVEYELEINNETVKYSKD